MIITKRIRVVDTHTAGEPTRIIISGLPIIKKKSIIEIKEEIRLKYDHIRKLLMHEPRGHSGMFGAIITPPIDKDSDFGVVFMDTGGYMNGCGHASIGIARYAIEAGLVEKKFPTTIVKVNTPSGNINLEVSFDSKKYIKDISLVNVKSFNYLSDIKCSIDQTEIPLDIAFGGNFFGIVDADSMGLDINLKNIAQIRILADKLFDYLSKNIKVIHPKIKDISSVDAIEFNTKKNLKDSDNKNVVIFDKNKQFDRSPCGTGTCAKLANLYHNKKINIGDKFINESIIGTQFMGTIIREDNSDGIKGIIPKVTTNAYITGYSDFVLEKYDPLKNGFYIP